MRNFSPRPGLNNNTRQELRNKTDQILQIPPGAARQKRARQLYDSARGSQWFLPIVNNLRALCGAGELCMYCSSSEPSQVEHYRPLIAFPERALEYENYLWSCDICNRAKGERFPPNTEAGDQILNPLEDNVWEHFFLDETFGRIIKRTNPATGASLPRAVSTCDIVRIDRENVQIKRQNRLKSLLREVKRTQNEYDTGQITVDQLRTEIAEMRNSPFQADVADYFLSGPGRLSDPFHSILVAAGEIVP